MHRIGERQQAQFIQQMTAAQSSHANVYDYIHHNYDNYSDDDGHQGGSSGTIRSSHWSLRGQHNPSNATATAAAIHTTPYRTNSHFGFCSPRSNQRPLHFHNATLDTTTQYVPLPRALSISEVLSSEQVQLCADAAVPQLLRNVIEQRPPLSLGALPEFAPAPATCELAPADLGMKCGDVDASGYATCGDDSGCTSEPAMPIVQTVVAEVYTIPDGRNSSLTNEAVAAVVPFQLEPLNDKENERPRNRAIAVESQADNDAAVQCDEQSTFLRKLAAMHYSSESLEREWQQQAMAAQMSGRQAAAHITVHNKGAAPVLAARGLQSASADARSQYDPMEQRILHRIDEFALDRVDPIFTTIRNHIIEYNSSKGSIEAQPLPAQQSLLDTTTDNPKYDNGLANRSASMNSLNISDVSPSPSSKRAANHFDDIGLFQGFGGRCSSTPKSVHTSTAATLNTRRVSARWAETRALNGSTKNSSSAAATTPTRAVPSPKPPSVNVSKLRSAECSPADVRQQPPRKKSAQPARNFIQENIAKAARKNHRCQQQPKQRNAATKARARVVVTTPNGTAIRSNVKSIFAIYPTSADPTADSVVQSQPPVGINGNPNGLLNIDTDSELGFSGSTSPQCSRSSGSRNDRLHESEVAAIQLDIERLLERPALAGPQLSMTKEGDSENDDDTDTIAAVHSQLNGHKDELDACIEPSSKYLAPVIVDALLQTPEEATALAGPQLPMTKEGDSDNDDDTDAIVASHSQHNGQKDELDACIEPIINCLAPVFVESLLQTPEEATALAGLQLSMTKEGDIENDDDIDAIVASHSQYNGQKGEMAMTPEDTIDAISSAHAQLDGQTDSLRAVIEQCAEHLASMHLEHISDEMTEIEELHGELEAGRAAERLADSERVRVEWERFNCLVHELGSEAD